MQTNPAMKFHRHWFGWNPSVLILLESKEKWVWLKQSESLVAVRSRWCQKMRQFYCPWRIARPWNNMKFAPFFTSLLLVPHRTRIAVKTTTTETLSKTSFCLHFRMFEKRFVFEFLNWSFVAHNTESCITWKSPHFIFQIKVRIRCFNKLLHS